MASFRLILGIIKPLQAPGWTPKWNSCHQPCTKVLNIAPLPKDKELFSSLWMWIFCSAKRWPRDAQFCAVHGHQPGLFKPFSYFPTELIDSANLEVWLRKNITLSKNDFTKYREKNNKTWYDIQLIYSIDYWLSCCLTKIQTKWFIEKGSRKNG